MTVLRKTATAALWCLASLGAQPAGAWAQDRALVIGIGTYENLPEDMFLHGPKNDVKAIQSLLTGTLRFKPEEIRVLTDDKATRQAILSSMDEWLIAGTAPGDRVYLYFSGHGLQVKDISGDEEDGMDEAISTYDLKAGDEDWTNVILDDELEAVLEKLKGRAVTLVIDACHSGTISRSLSREAVSALQGARYLPRPFAQTTKQPATRGPAHRPRRYRQARAIDGRWADRLECCGCLSGGVGRCSPAGRRSAWCFHIRLHSRLQT